MDSMWSHPLFNPVDLPILGLLLYGLIHGLVRGLSRELARLVGFAATLAAAWLFYRPVGRYLFEHTRLAERGAHALAFVLILVAAMVVVLAVRLVLQKALEFTFKGPLERVGGAVAGLLQAVVAGAAILYALSLLPYEPMRRAIREESWSGRQVCRLFPVVYQSLSERYNLPELPGAEPPPDGAPPARDPGGDEPTGEAPPEGGRGAADLFE